MLRKYFDSYVLDIQVDQFSESELRKIREQTERIYENNLLDGTTQITNTGYDYFDYVGGVTFDEIRSDKTEIIENALKKLGSSKNDADAVKHVLLL